MLAVTAMPPEWRKASCQAVLQNDEMPALILLKRAGAYWQHSDVVQHESKLNPFTGMTSSKTGGSCTAHHAGLYRCRPHAFVRQSRSWATITTRKYRQRPLMLMAIGTGLQARNRRLLLPFSTPSQRKTTCAIDRSDFRSSGLRRCMLEGQIWRHFPGPVFPHWLDDDFCLGGDSLIQRNTGSRIFERAFAASMFINFGTPRHFNWAEGPGVTGQRKKASSAHCCTPVLSPASVFTATFVGLTGGPMVFWWANFQYELVLSQALGPTFPLWVCTPVECTQPDTAGTASGLSRVRRNDLRKNQARFPDATFRLEEFVSVVVSLIWYRKADRSLPGRSTVCARLLPYRLVSVPRASAYAVQQ